MSDLRKLEDLRLLYCPFTLTDKSLKSDMENIEALYALLMGQGHTRWFTHLIVVVRSWQEVPYAIDGSVIKSVLNLCKFFNFPVIWGRNLWVSWPSDKLKAPMPDKWQYRYAAYYAAAIANLKAEARHLGAAGTFLDAEPYGDSVHKEILKNKPEILEHSRIRASIYEAVAGTGPVDIIYPYDSMNPKKYTWLMSGLGRIRWGAKMYYTRDPSKPINANPPDGVAYVPGLITSFATKVSRAVGSPKQMTLTPAEVRAIDMNLARKRFPSIQGQGIYIPYAEFAEVVKAWNG